MSEKVLIVDDNDSICQALSLLLMVHGYQSIICHTPEDAIKALMYQSVGLIIQDMNFTQDTTSGREGKDLFHQLREINIDIPIILITAWAQLEMAVELVKEGAADYISKPWDDVKLLTTIKNLFEMSELRLENKRLLKANKQQKAIIAETKSNNRLCGLVYQSMQMQRLIDMSMQVAKADIPVLITGANGSGKEKIADIIHANSNRKAAPFIKVNVGALPLDLMEAELFGAEAGAYTGASKKRIGRFEAANGGTLFLDEIGNLPLSGQIKLLRVLQTGEFERLGSHESKKVDVRVISATNANLLDDIDSGTFREDLFYRLNVIELSIPALNQRPDDIMPLVKHFMASEDELSSEVQMALMAHDWSGNVRELENACKRATILKLGQEYKIEDFGLIQRAKNERISEPLDAIVELKASSVDTNKNDLSKYDIEQALEAHGHVISRAAKSLGLSRQALYRRMNKLGMTNVNT